MKRSIFLVFLQAFFCTAHAQVSVSAQIDSIQILIGEQAHLSISVIAPEQQEVVFPTIRPRTYLVPNLEVVEELPADTIHHSDKTREIKRTWALTSFDEALYAIPSQTIRAGKKEYKTNQLALKVITMEVDTLHPEQFFPPKDVQNMPFSWREWLPLLWLSMLLVLLILAHRKVREWIKKRKPIIKSLRLGKRLKPHQKALAAMEKLKANRSLMEQDPKSYYTHLTDVLRQYLNERFEFNAMEMTTDEIVSHLYALDEHHMTEEIQELLQTADLVKFAKHETLLDESDRNLLNAMRFVDETKQEETEEDKKEQSTPEETQGKRERKALIALSVALFIAILLLLGYIAFFVVSLLR